MSRLLNAGEVLARNARLLPERTGVRDLERAHTFRQWNARACRLANALVGLGLAKGDRVAVLAYNCLEWAEICTATAKAGLVTVPINFRLVGSEIRYILENCEAAALIVQDELLGSVEELRSEGLLPARNWIHFGRRSCPAGFRDYEDLLSAARDAEPGIEVLPADPWMLLYISGTTGRPKGAIRSHLGNALLSLVIEVELSISRRDAALLVMPLCHANSLYFLGAFASCGATCSIYSRQSFDPEYLLRTLAEEGVTFTSLVPTHYIMMLGLPAAVRAKHNFDNVRKLMVSSAPARRDTKLEILEFFKNSGLYEVYGSTETGLVTILHPEEQLTKLGSVGRECIGSAPIKLLDRDGNEVADGAAGELYSCNPYPFDGYWKLPDKTAEAFKGAYCTVGDMARRDQDGYIYLVDRKSNMIISGGENVYPSEVEALLGANPKIKDVAVIGIPDQKWGERVHAVVILREGVSCSPDELLDWCKNRIAGYKRPRSASIISEEAMPRTATGKILHRELRAKYARADS